MTLSLLKNPFVKKTLRTLKLVLGLGLIACLLLLIDRAEFLRILLQANAIWLLVTLLVTFIVFDFQGLLLRTVAAPFAKLPHGRIFVFTLIGRFFSLFFPSAVGGDVVKALYLFPYFQKRSDAYAAIIMHRFLSGLSTLFISFVATLTYLPMQYRHSLVMFLIGCSILGLLLFGLYYFNRVMIWNIAWRLGIKRDGARGLGKMFYSLGSSILAYRYHKAVLLKTFLLGVVGTFLVTGLYLLVANTLYIPLSFQQALVSASVTQLSVLIPLTPGGLGVSEGAFVAAASIMGIVPEQAAAIVLTGRLIGYFAAAPGGILYMMMPVNSQVISKDRKV